MLHSLTLHDFRCFTRCDFSPSAGLNLISAPNASGKSSLLEAICVLLRLQSPRATSLAEAIHLGENGFSLAGRFNNRTLSLHYSKVAGRKLLLDDLPLSKSDEYLRIALVVFFSNDDMTLICGSSSKRRRYLDFLGSQCDAGYLKQLRAYERALRSRNFLLKEGSHRNRELAAYDAPFITSGEYLARVRHELCVELAPLIASHAAAISPQNESASIRYAPSGFPDLASALAASSSEERRLRQTIVGPHRDDLTIFLQNAEAATYASEGQQRTLALALRLAQADLIFSRRKIRPLFLLDDIFGELDTARRHRLLAALPSDAQRILTTTSWQWLDIPVDAATWSLQNGSLS